MGGVQGILSKALEGRGGESPNRWVGHSAKHYESGNTPDEEASALTGRDQPIAPDNIGLTDGNDAILRKQLRGYKDTKVAHILKLGFDMDKLAVTPPSESFLLTLGRIAGDGGPLNLDGLYAAAKKNDQYQADGEVPRAGILKDPEGFLGSGFDEAGPTTVEGAANLNSLGPGTGVDDMANYRDEQAMKTVKREMQINKKAALLLKTAMSPPMSGIQTESPVPNDEDPDFRRVTGRPSDIKPTTYAPTTRGANLRPRSSAIKSAASAMGTATISTATPSADFASRMQKSMKSTVGTKVKAKATKTKPLDVVRDETTGSLGKVPQGYSEMDPKVPDSPSGTDSKVAALLKKCFR